MEFLKELKLCAKNVTEKESMKQHTSFKIGGDADFMVFAENAEEIRAVIGVCEKHGVKYTVLGNGSNVLVSDRGIEGVVIKIAEGMSEVRIADNKILAKTGVLLSTLSRKAAEAGLSGLEFAAGIPGTLGGALFMNAGAYGGELKDVCTKVTYMNKNGEIIEIPGEEAGFGYRKSIFSGGEYVILGAELILQQGNKEEIFGKMAELNARRREKQPLNLPSAGSTFKRPEGYFAGQLIEETGLKGFRVGGAEVSEKHSGFVVNVGNAAAEDVKQLIKNVQERVFERFGVMLEPEVRFIGR